MTGNLVLQLRQGKAITVGDIEIRASAVPDNVMRRVLRVWVDCKPVALLLGEPYPLSNGATLTAVKQRGRFYLNIAAEKNIPIHRENAKVKR